MGEEYRESLLKKKYYENCPGCKVEQYKAVQRGIPFRELIFTWVIVLCTGKYSHRTLCIYLYAFHSCFIVDQDVSAFTMSELCIYQSNCPAIFHKATFKSHSYGREFFCLFVCLFDCLFVFLIKWEWKIKTNILELFSHMSLNFSTTTRTFSDMNIFKTY